MAKARKTAKTKAKTSTSHFPRSPRFTRPRSGREIVDVLVRRIHAPVDIASLVYFRIIFGAIMIWEVYRYVSKGWIARYWIDPPFHFTYAGFEWVQPWPGNGMYVHFAVMAAMALCIMLGLFYRVAAALFFLAFTHFFLMEKAVYLNHFYFVILISFSLIFVPAHRALSLDAWIRPKLRASTAPAWALWLLMAQVGIVYFYGGLAKINGDWLRGEPMRMWMAPRTDFPFIGQWFTEEWMIYAFSYGGLFFDLLIVPALLWRRTRLLAFGVAIVFHMTNVQLFNIGIFPWFTLAATVLYFPPDLPRRIVQRIRSFGFFGARPAASEPRPADNTASQESSALFQPARMHYVALLLVVVYVGAQMLVPLRHHLYPGDVAWTEEGHRYSWRMKLRSKQGIVTFYATNRETGTTWEVDPARYLTPHQIGQMATQPDMIMQFSHYLHEQLLREWRGNTEIRAEAWVSLNGRPPQLLIDPSVDLTQVGHSIRPVPWITPLTTPFQSTATTREVAAAGVELEE